MGLPALTSTKYVIRGNGQIENNNKKTLNWLGCLLL